MTFILSNGLGYLLSAINVKYRDIRYALPFFIQLLLFLTPVIYPTDIGGAKYSWIFLLNPMTGFINAHRSCILGHTNLDVTGLLISSVLTIIIFIIGIIYFKKTESYFADIIWNLYSWGKKPRDFTRLILSRITHPTEGEVILKSRVGSLLEVGTGFHPELTGRENIYLSMSIYRMKVN